MSDGKLYHCSPIFGIEGSYEVQRTDVSESGNKIKYTLEVMYCEMGERYPEDDLVYFFIKEDGRWVVDEISEYDLAVDFVCRCPLC